MGNPLATIGAMQVCPGLVFVALAVRSRHSAQLRCWAGIARVHSGTQLSCGWELIKSFLRVTGGADFLGSWVVGVKAWPGRAGQAAARGQPAQEPPRRQPQQPGGWRLEWLATGSATLRRLLCGLLFSFGPETPRACVAFWPCGVLANQGLKAFPSRSPPGLHTPFQVDELFMLVVQHVPQLLLVVMLIYIFTL